MSESTSTIAPNRFPMARVTWAGLTRPVHEGIVEQFEYIISQWEARGGQRAYEIRSWWGYATRPQDKGAHPRGVGIDINPAENPMVAKRTPCPSDMPQWFIDLWLAQGFGHGGYWASKCDAMHQSKMPNEGGNGRIYERPSGLVVTTTTPTPPKPVLTQEEDMLVMKVFDSSAHFLLSGGEVRWLNPKVVGSFIDLVKKGKLPFLEVDRRFIDSWNTDHAETIAALNELSDN